MRKQWIVIICGIILASCLRAENGREIDLSLVSASQHCGHQAGLSLITSAADWQQQMGIKPTPEVDLKQRRLLIIRMGTQPNPGYSLKYEGGAVIAGHTLKIPLVWQTPDPDKIYPQMIVEPCLIFSMPAQGYHSIQVLDQNNSIKFELKASE